MEVIIKATEGDDFAALDVYLNILDMASQVGDIKGPITVEARVENMPEGCNGYWEMLEDYMPGQYSGHPGLGYI